MILLPPTYHDVSGPVLFLAGPIKGAPLWQNDAITILQQHAPHIHIANPRRKYAPGEYAFDEQDALHRRQVHPTPADARLPERATVRDTRRNLLAGDCLGGVIARVRS